MAFMVKLWGQGSRKVRRYHLFFFTYFDHKKNHSQVKVETMKLSATELLVLLGQVLYSHDWSRVHIPAAVRKQLSAGFDVCIVFKE